MNHFFSCKKHKSSTKNIITNSNISKKKEEEKFNKNKEKEDNKGQEQLLFLNNDGNDSINNLEIIDYPYSTNNNKDNETIKMNSPYEDKDRQKSVEQITNEVSTNLVIEEKENNIKRHQNFYFYQNISNNSSGIIKNEDSVQQKKTLLKNYYNLMKLNNINKTSPFPDSKEEKNNISNKINRLENNVTDNKSEVKFEFPRPPCPDNQNIQALLNKSKTNFFILADNSNIKIQKNNIKNFKNNKVIIKNKKNKTIESQGKRKEAFKLKKLILMINSNRSYFGNKGNISKDNSKIYNTSSVYLNKSYNNLNEYKIYKGKLRNIKNKKVENKTRYVIKKKKILSKINTNRTLQNIELMKNKGKSLKYIKNVVKSKPMYSSSNLNCKSSLLNRMNKELDTIRKTFSRLQNQRIVNKQIKNKNEKNKIIYKKLNLNPFKSEENILKK